MAEAAAVAEAIRIRKEAQDARDAQAAAEDAARKQAAKEKRTFTDMDEDKDGVVEFHEFQAAGKKQEASSKAVFVSDLNSDDRNKRYTQTVKKLVSTNQMGSLDLTVARSKEDQEKFRQQTEDIRRRLRSMERRTINPQSKFMRYWDQIVVLALLFTAFVTPFEVAFAGEYIGIVNFTANRIVDAIFAIDIVLAFFIPYRASPAEGGQWVYDNRKIAEKYLRGWFFLDLFTAIPFSVIVQYAATQNNLAVDSTMFMVLRCLRVVKLARIIRGSRIIRRWQDSVGMSYAHLSLLRFLVGTLVLAHWMACVWGFAGRSQRVPPDDDDDLLVWDSYEGFTWTEKHRVHGDMFQVYGVALYVALNNIFGGSCEINPSNYYEFYIQSVMLVIGSSVWAYVIGSACGIIATIDPALIEHRQTMDELNFFVKDQGIPEELGVRLRAYFRNTLYLVRAKRYDQLLTKMSTRLRGDSSFQLASRRMRQVPYFAHPDLEPEFLCHLATRFEIAVFSRRERIPCQNLFVIDRGIVAKNGRLGLSVRGCFGEDVIVSNDSLRDLGDAVAITFVQIIQLSREDIYELLPDFPIAYAIVRRHAFRLAFARLVVKAADLAKMNKSVGSPLKEAMYTVVKAPADEMGGVASAFAKSKPFSNALTAASFASSLQNYRDANKAEATMEEIYHNETAGLATNRQTSSIMGLARKPQPKLSVMLRPRLLPTAAAAKLKGKGAEKRVIDLGTRLDGLQQAVTKRMDNLEAKVDGLVNSIEQKLVAHLQARRHRHGEGSAEHRLSPHKSRKGRREYHLSRDHTNGSAPMATPAMDAAPMAGACTASEVERNELRAAEAAMDADAGGGSVSLSTPFDA